MNLRLYFSYKNDYFNSLSVRVGSITTLWIILKHNAWYRPSHREYYLYTVRTEEVRVLPSFLEIITLGVYTSYYCVIVIVLLLQISSKLTLSVGICSCVIFIVPAI